MKSLQLLLILSFLAFIGCKESDRDDDTTVNSCASYGTGQSYTYDVFKLTHQAALSSKGITTANLADTTSLFGCDTLIVDTTTNPMTITIQFNDTCTSGANKRSGSIQATFTGKYDNLGTVVTLTFTNYSYNNYRVTGSMSYNYQGVIDNFPTFGVSSNLSFVNNKNRTIVFSGNQTLAITSGEATATYDDDIYSITGNSTGRALEGNDFNVIMDENITLNGSCNWVNSGTVTVSPENKQPRTLDFGSSCDNKGTVQIYDLTHEVEFPE